MGFGNVDNGNGHQPLPGQILLNNTYLGEDENPNFVRLRDERTGLEFRCRVKFSDVHWKGSPPMDHNNKPSPIPLFFDLAKDSPKLFYPVVFSFCEDHSFLLQPPIADRIFPGGVVPNLTLSPGNDDSWNVICLRRMGLFYDGTLISDGNGHHFERNKYEMMVHHSGDINSLQLEKPCLALVYKLQRHFRGQSTQRYKHVDASLLSFYDDLSVVRGNLSQLTELRARYDGTWKLKDGTNREYWFDNLDQLPSDLFESITRRVDKSTPSDQNTHNNSISGSNSHKRVSSSTTKSPGYVPIGLSAYGRHLPFSKH